MKRLSFAKRALEDFQDIHDYIAKENADAALKFIGRLEDRCNQLAAFPGTGRKRDHVKAGYRNVTDGDYAIYYQMVNEDELLIVRIVHSKQDINKAILDSDASK